MDGQMSIFDFPEWLPEEVKENPIWSEVHCGTDSVINKGKPDHMICRFSEHTCNKEELWKVAQTFDDIQCPKVCCRQCSVRLCGARCNGSEEPKRDPKLDIPKLPVYHISLSHVWEECPNCKGQNRLSIRKLGLSGNYYTEYLDRCPDCGQSILWDWDQIDKNAKKTADVKACELAGLSGPVSDEELQKAREQYKKSNRVKGA